MIQNSEFKTSQSIKQLVFLQIIENWESQDEPEHLRTVRDRILRNARSSQKLLKTYQEILRKGKITDNNCHEHLELRLSGLVIRKKGSLVVKNKIYKSVFNIHWVKQHLKTSNQEVISLPFWNSMLASILITILVVGIRSLGLLQAWELQAFDQLMRQRPKEQPDDRILLVTITEDDVQSQPIAERGAASLSNRSLDQLLKKLQKYEAKVIGLDIYWEIPVEAKYKNLIATMQNSDRFFAICLHGKPGVPPPKEVPPASQGFNNVLRDEDRVIRRHLLAFSEDAPPCENQYAFNWQLATRYLADKGIYTEFTSDNYLKLKNTVFKTIESNSGGYHKVVADSHQILLNYRASNQIAEKVSLQEVLSNQFNSDLVKNRIVIIGTIALSFKDYWPTPYSGNNWSVTTMSGVEVQAHMVSQIISTVLDNRPLIWNLSEFNEIIWIFCWSFIGGFFAWYLRSSQPIKIIAATSINLAVFYGTCWFFLVVNGAWLPLVPVVLALMCNSGIILIRIYIYKQQ